MSLQAKHEKRKKRKLSNRDRFRLKIPGIFSRLEKDAIVDYYYKDLEYNNNSNFQSKYNLENRYSTSPIFLNNRCEIHPKFSLIKKNISYNQSLSCKFAEKPIYKWEDIYICLKCTSIKIMQQDTLAG